MHFLIICLGWQQKMTPDLGPVPSMWEIQMKFQVTGLGLARPQLLQPLGSDQQLEDLSIHLPLSLFQIKKISYILRTININNYR